VEHARDLWLSASPPPAPQAVSAVAGDGHAIVSFTAPPAGDEPVTYHTATAAPGGQTGFGLGSPITVHGRQNGVSNTFTVTAVNVAGTGAPSPCRAQSCPSGRTGSIPIRPRRRRAPLPPTWPPGSPAAPAGPAAVIRRL
jgi:hypothetical protein